MHGPQKGQFDKDFWPRLAESNAALLHRRFIEADRVESTAQVLPRGLPSPSQQDFTQLNGAPATTGHMLTAV